MERVRRRVVAALLVAFALWPIAHFQLVQRYQLNPWKFGGWAMYTTPSIMPIVEVRTLDAGRRVLTPMIGSRLDEAAAELERLRMEIFFWGKLADTEPLARIAQRVLQPEGGIEIDVIQPSLDRTTARIVLQRDTFFYFPDRAPTTKRAPGSKRAP